MFPRRGDVSPEQRQALDISTSLGSLPQDRHSVWQAALRNYGHQFADVGPAFETPERSEDPTMCGSVVWSSTLLLLSQVMQWAGAGTRWGLDLHRFLKARAPDGLHTFHNHVPVLVTSAKPSHGPDGTELKPSTAPASCFLAPTVLESLVCLLLPLPPPRTPPS